MTLAVFVYSVGGILRISYIVAVLLTAVLFCLTVGKLLLFFADYIRFCTIVTLLYISLPFRLLFSFIFTAFSTLLLQFYKLYVIIYTKVYIIRSNGRHRNMERKWQGAVMQLVSEWIVVAFSVTHLFFCCSPFFVFCKAIGSKRLSDCFFALRLIKNCFRRIFEHILQCFCDMMYRSSS